MKLSAPKTADLHELLWQFRAGTASSEQLGRLERMVVEDPRVRSFYVRYMHMCADLCWTAPPVEQPAARDNGQADPRQRPEAERRVQAQGSPDIGPSGRTEEGKLITRSAPFQFGRARSTTHCIEARRLAQCNALVC